MPLDGISMHYLANELREHAIGCRADKIHQPSRDEFVFQLRSRIQAGRLLFSATANGPRVHFTRAAPENPAPPPMLCMLFRKHLGGAVLTDVRQLGLDRVLFFDFSATNELGDRVCLTLCAECMAKHSNLILINAQGIILDSVRRIGPGQSSVRQIQPGLAYEPPPQQNKQNLLLCPADAVAEAVCAQAERTLSAALLAVLEGASPLLCREIANRICGADLQVSELDDTMRQSLTQILQELRGQLLDGKANPTLLLDTEGKPADFSCYAIRQYGDSRETRSYDRISDLLDDFYRERDWADRIQQRAADLMKLLSSAEARIAKKLALQRAELAASTQRELLRVSAELIQANQFRLEKGSLFYDLENYYDNNAPLRIPANPALSPAANAQKYYKDYRKAKTAEEKLQTLIVEGEAELAYLETVSDALLRASGHAEIGEIREELAQAGYGKRQRSQQAGRPQKSGRVEKPLPPLRYTSSDGFTILVGRNNLQNDRLSLREAKKEDLWLHAQKYPGSHVIVVGEGREIPESTVLEAARLAAWHSKARESARVPVDYTPVRHLKKPQGAKPGMVIYHVYRTVWVAPVESVPDDLPKQGS